MAGLESLTGDDPSGSESPAQGDNRIRELTQKVKESVSKEHSLTGYHAILSGNSSNRPTFGNEGRFYILETNGVATELQYDTGSAWESITKNQVVLNLVTSLQDHKDSTTMTHANSSVKKQHLAGGVITRHHVSQSAGNLNNSGSLANLINGSELPDDGTWHTHTVAESSSASSAPTFLSSTVELVSDSVALGSNTGEKTINLSGSDIPAGAVAVILEGVCRIDLYAVNADVTYSPKIEIQGRLSNGNDSAWALLVGGYIGYKGTLGDSNTYSMGWKGQGIFPITTTGGQARKINYKAYSCNKRETSSYDNGFEIRLVGYI